MEPRGAAGWTVTKCRHGFHAACIYRWWSTSAEARGAGLAQGAGDVVGEALFHGAREQAPALAERCVGELVGEQAIGLRGARPEGSCREEQVRAECEGMGVKCDRCGIVLSPQDLVSGRQAWVQQLRQRGRQRAGEACAERGRVHSCVCRVWRAVCLADTL